MKTSEAIAYLVALWLFFGATLAVWNRSRAISATALAVMVMVTLFLIARARWGR
jgi:hypothetical protein